MLSNSGVQLKQVVRNAELKAVKEDKVGDQLYLGSANRGDK